MTSRDILIAFSNDFRGSTQRYTLAMAFAFTGLFGQGMDYNHKKVTTNRHSDGVCFIFDFPGALWLWKLDIIKEQIGSEQAS